MHVRMRYPRQRGQAGSRHEANKVYDIVSAHAPATKQTMRQNSLSPALGGGKSGRCCVLPPMGLVVAILRGMRDTADAEREAAHQDVPEELLHAVRVVEKQVGAGEHDDHDEAKDLASAAIDLNDCVTCTDGKKLPFVYEDHFFKDAYVDEYTGEVLPR